MKNIEWKDKVASFKKIDVRGIAGNFLDGLKKQAAKLPVGEGIEVIQSFEPIPLYEIMEMLGYVHYTEKTAEHEYHAYFYRTEEKGNVEDAPERPAVIANYPMIDEKLKTISRLQHPAPALSGQCRRCRKDAAGHAGTAESLCQRAGFQSPGRRV